MWNFSRLAIAASLLVAVQNGHGAPAPAAVPPAAASTPECWVEHTQVQPSPTRPGSAGAPAAGAAVLALNDQHAGAEHPTKLRKRACNALRPPAGQKTGVGAVRTLAP